MRARRRLGVLAVALSLAVAVGVGVPASESARADDEVPEVTRVLIYGDSVTHGAAGDYTWRYRLWRHLVNGGEDVDFVGPRTDLFDHIKVRPGSQAYLDPAFDRDHAARWGMTLSRPDWPVAELVADHEADVVVEMLGLNDLGFLHLSPEQVGEELRELVASARSANPAVSVVLAEASKTSRADVLALDPVLAEVAAELDTPEARVVVARLPDQRNLDVLTWDGTHPSAQGEVEIAASVADALASMGLGDPYPRPLPRVPLGPRRAPVLRVQGGDGVARLAWNQVPGVDLVRVGVRDVTRGGRFKELEYAVPGLSWRAQGLVNGHVYAFRLRPQRTRLPAEGVVSNTVRVRPLPPRPGPVRELRVRHLGPNWIRVSGRPARHARWYRLEAAAARTCRRPPPRLRVRSRVLLEPVGLATTRAPRLWVRLVAVNEAGVDPGRTACVVMAR